MKKNLRISAATIRTRIKTEHACEAPQRRKQVFMLQAAEPVWFDGTHSFGTQDTLSLSLDDGLWWMDTPTVKCLRLLLLLLFAVVMTWRCSYGGWDAFLCACTFSNETNALTPWIYIYIYIYICVYSVQCTHSQAQALGAFCCTEQHNVVQFLDRFVTSKLTLTHTERSVARVFQNECKMNFIDSFRLLFFSPFAYKILNIVEVENERQACALNVLHTHMRAA